MTSHHTITSFFQWESARTAVLRTTGRSARSVARSTATRVARTPTASSALLPTSARTARRRSTARRSSRRPQPGLSKSLMLYSFIPRYSKYEFDSVDCLDHGLQRISAVPRLTQCSGGSSVGRSTGRTSDGCSLVPPRTG